MEIYERLKLLRKEDLKLTQSEIAKSLGIAPTTYAMIETGKRTLRVNYIKGLSHQYNINEEWLLTGEGEKFTISPIGAKLLSTFKAMSPKTQEYLLKISSDLLKLETDIKKESL